MKIISTGESSFRIAPDIFDLSALSAEIEFVISSYAGEVPDGFRHILNAEIGGDIRAQLIDFGIIDTDAAIRQLSFYGRKMAKERKLALEALARLLSEERARLEDGETA